MAHQSGHEDPLVTGCLCDWVSLTKGAMGESMSRTVIFPSPVAEPTLQLRALLVLPEASVSLQYTHFCEALGES